MPTLPPLPNVSRVVLTWTYGGVACANVLHYRGPNLTGPPDSDDIAARIAANYTFDTAAISPTTASLTGIKVTPLDPTQGPATETTVGYPKTGSNTSPQLPNQVTAVTTFRTAFGGRSFRGRAYWIGLTEGGVIANVLDETVRAQINAYWERMRILEAGSGEVQFELVVVSYYSGGVLRTTPVATAVTAVSTNNRVDTQRRRLP
jgi:hypothetical protein